MIGHILAEIIGTLVYVGSHHITNSNAAITSLALFIAMTTLNQFAGDVGVSLNPLASIVNYLFGEQGFMGVGIIILSQILAIFILFYFFKTMGITVVV